jgi:hypothetical protein
MLLRIRTPRRVAEGQRFFIPLRVSFSLTLPVFLRISPSAVSGLNQGIDSDTFLFFASLRF